jgi:hypothetical protein
VGQTGLGVGTADIMFDKNGKLYGLSGTLSTDVNFLLVIDTTNGFGYKINTTAKTGLQALALNPDGVANFDASFTQIPKEFSLEQNYPNPFNPVTSIQYNLPVSAQVELRVFDALGKEIVTLVDGYRQPGVHKEYFDASGMASGVYYYKIIAGSFSDAKKMVVVK